MPSAIAATVPNNMPNPPANWYATSETTIKHATLPDIDLLVQRIPHLLRWGYYLTAICYVEISYPLIYGGVVDFCCRGVLDLLSLCLS